MKKIIFTGLLLCISIFAFGQASSNKAETCRAKKKAKAVVETSFQVSGVCGMCKDRIENALSVKGVKMATWDRDTEMCRVIYRTDKVEEAELHRLINEVGHDTALSKASDEEYATVHECCKYRDGASCGDE